MSSVGELVIEHHHHLGSALTGLSTARGTLNPRDSLLDVLVSKHQF